MPVGGKGFSGEPERHQGPLPKVVEIGTDDLEGIGLDGVDPAGAFGTIGDQPDVFEHLEMLRHRGTTHRQCVREHSHRRGSFAQHGDDRPS